MHSLSSESNELKQRGYEIGAKLGFGSYATVKSAIWKQPGKETSKQVAVKIINSVDIPKDFKEKFLPRELAVVKDLDHDNVIRTLDIFHGQKKIYLILEYAAHGDLLQFIRCRGPVKGQKCAKMFRQIVEGLQYIHEMNIVHRDLKCENILLNQANTLKIADFGFARRMYNCDLSKTFCGSMAYAAPEIIKGRPYIGISADIWSIGVILFIMLTAIMPFRDLSVSSLSQDQKKPLRYPNKSSVCDDAKVILNSILRVKSIDRPTTSQLLEKDWLKIKEITSTTSEIAI